jgi:hypothetical protein
MLGQPNHETQVHFLLSVQRLLNEGAFTATYKYALHRPEIGHVTLLWRADKIDMSELFLCAGVRQLQEVL